MAATIHYDVQDGVARLTLDQEAKKNALSFEMWSMLPDLVRRASANPDIRLILVRGAGEAAFCAGADISQFGDKRTGEAATGAYDRAVADAMAALSAAPKPTLAAIRGICFGGGLALALCCSLRIASAESRFRIPAGRLGLGYGFGNVRSLVHRLGPAATADILFTARIFDSAEALRLDVVQRVAPADSFEDAVAALAAEITANAPLTLAAVKQALAELERPEAQRDEAAVAAAIARCFGSADYREGQAAFRERREPRFTGR
jgi:enoyl-CoA hydratase/carnithine racemase